MVGADIVTRRAARQGGRVTPETAQRELNARVHDAVTSYETPTGLEFPGVSLIAAPLMRAGGAPDCDGSTGRTRISGVRGCDQLVEFRRRDGPSTQHERAAPRGTSPQTVIEAVWRGGIVGWTSLRC
jgi:hypothetical protein